MRQPNIIQATRPIAAQPSLPWKGLICLLIVYLVWGSTYLAIRTAVGGGDFTPYALGSVRLLAAGALVLGWAAATGRRIRLPRPELAGHALAALLLWVGGNGLVTWSLTRVDSGYAGLMMGTMPIFAAVIDALVERRAPGRRPLFGLLLGAMGIAILSAPALGQGGAVVGGLIGLAFAAMSWAGGAAFQKRRRAAGDPIVSAGWVLLFGGVGFAVVALARGESVAASPDAGSWLALAYLVVVGSIVGFGCYLFALRLLPPDLVMTHAYVNPVVAVILGWAIMGEPLGPATFAAASLVLAGVYLVFSGRSGSAR